MADADAAPSPAPHAETVTAAVLVIGDEILSGRTADTNINSIARFLAPYGVDLREVRVAPDVHEEIVEAERALSGRYDYLFTTGGIGPTHDDITADAVAEAMGVELAEDAEVVALLTARANGEPPNAARRRMARMPPGAGKIAHPQGGPPGFAVGNVFVMAGVPGIMKGMLEDIGPRLRTGAVTHASTLRVGVGEGVLAAPLEAVAKAHPDMSLGSYPFFTAEGYGANLVVRGRDAAEVDAVVEELRTALEAAGVSAIEAVDG